MKLLNSILNFFSNDRLKRENIDWVNFEQLDQISNFIIPNSWEKPILIYIHDTKCSISKFVLDQFEQNFDLKEFMKTYFLDIKKRNTIIDEVSKQFQIQQDSPQIIVIKKGVVVYSSLNEAIDVIDLKQFV